MMHILREKIKEMKIENCVSPEEVILYLNVDSYEEDIYTAESILKNEYLVVHEILESLLHKGAREKNCE